MIDTQARAHVRIRPVEDLAMVRADPDGISAAVRVMAHGDNITGITAALALATKETSRGNVVVAGVAAGHVGPDYLDGVWALAPVKVASVVVAISGVSVVSEYDGCTWAARLGLNLRPGLSPIGRVTWARR